MAFVKVSGVDYRMKQNKANHFGLIKLAIVAFLEFLSVRVLSSPRLIMAVYTLGYVALSCMHTSCNLLASIVDKYG